MPCVAIILSGANVGKRCQNFQVGGETRCRVHLNSLRNHGPNTIQIMELKAVKLDLPVNILNKELIDRAITVDEYEVSHRLIQTRYHADRRQLIDRQIAEIRRTGIDPDAPAKDLKEQKKQERNRRRFQNLRVEIPDNIHDVLGPPPRMPNWAQQLDPFLHHIDAARGGRVADINNNIRDFANDNQNVHTTIAVKQTQDVINKVLTIPVPEEYRWNADICSKTPAEVIVECKLKQQAVLQMMMKYTSNETIYEMENGIYGKTLDAVWQFIKNSDDKTCLINVLKTELEDNIGMCAQGNLTRLANVMAGYVDGIKPPRSTAEVLGEEFAHLSTLTNVEERIDMGAHILRQYGVPVAEWEAWLEPLADDKEFSIENGNVLVH